MYAPDNASRDSQKNPTESAATLVRRGGCLRSCGLFNGNRVCAVDEAIEAHSLNRHAPGLAQRHGFSIEQSRAADLAAIIDAASPLCSFQPEPGGITVFRSMPWLVGLAHRKACASEKSLLNAVPTIWRLSLMPSAPPLVNSPAVFRTAAGLDCSPRTQHESRRSPGYERTRPCCPRCLTVGKSRLRRHLCNEFPSGRSQRHRGAYAVGPEHRMRFDIVFVRAVAEDVAHRIDVTAAPNRSVWLNSGR